MKNFLKIFGIIAVAALIGFMASCSDDGGFDPGTAVYSGEDMAGNKYVLTITEKDGRASYQSAAGDSYELTITYTDGTKKTSNGKVKDVKTDGTFELEPSVPGSSTFSIVTKNGQIKSVVGEIALAGGEFIVPSTFDTLYLRVNRWTGLPPNKNSYGEQWTTGLCVNLSDFIEGDIKSFVQYDVTIRGTVEISDIVADTALENANIEIWWIPSGKISDWLPSNKWIGGSYDGSFKRIPSGRFETTYAVTIYEDNIEKGSKPVWVQFTNVFLYVDNDGNVIDDFGRIPEHIPNGTIVGTISGFEVEIVEVGYVGGGLSETQLHGEWKHTEQSQFSFTIAPNGLTFEHEAQNITLEYIGYGTYDVDSFALFLNDQGITGVVFSEGNTYTVDYGLLKPIDENVSIFLLGLHFIYIADPNNSDELYLWYSSKLLDQDNYIYEDNIIPSGFYRKL